MTGLTDVTEIRVEYMQQEYSCCQLISAINARMFLGGSRIGRREFESLVDLVYCRNGAAMFIARGWMRLGLSIKHGPHTTDWDWIEKNLPVQLTVWTKDQGFHSVVVLGMQGQWVYIANLGKKVRFTQKEIESYRERYISKRKFSCYSYRWADKDQAICRLWRKRIRGHY